MPGRRPRAISRDTRDVGDPPTLSRKPNWWAVGPPHPTVRRMGDPPSQSHPRQQILIKCREPRSRGRWTNRAGPIPGRLRALCSADRAPSTRRHLSSSGSSWPDRLRPSPLVLFPQRNTRCGRIPVPLHIGKKDNKLVFGSNFELAITIWVLNLINLFSFKKYYYLFLTICERIHYLIFSGD